MNTREGALHRCCNRLTAAASLLAFTLAQGCYSYQRPPKGGVGPGDQVELRASRPFAVELTPADTMLTITRCEARLLRGTVATQRGDTLWFSRVAHASGSATPEQACPTGTRARVAMSESADAKVDVRRISVVRTTGMAFGVVVVTLAVVGIIVAGVAVGSLLDYR